MVEGLLLDPLDAATFKSAKMSGHGIPSPSSKCSAPYSLQRTPGKNGDGNHHRRLRNERMMRKWKLSIQTSNTSPGIIKLYMYLNTSASEMY